MVSTKPKFGSFLRGIKGGMAVKKIKLPQSSLKKVFAQIKIPRVKISQVKISVPRFPKIKVPRLRFK